ncbi:MAG: hypothetical protein QGH15_18765 [Kiritimatiellia bacterium]|jgi:hypothetical protein|nr:hypothetical protein [Kiritimatiellia bacterium]
MPNKARTGSSGPCALLCACSHPVARAAETNVDYVAVARAYADCMIEHGRDRYGSVHSPLFVTGTWPDGCIVMEIIACITTDDMNNENDAFS